MSRTGPDAPDRALRRHAEHYRAVGARVEEGAADGTDITLRASLRLDLPNLRAGLDWSLGSGDRPAGDPVLGADLVGATAWLWGALPREGLHWVGRALARLEQAAPPEASRHVRYAAGMISFSIDLNASGDLLAEAARLAESCDDVPLQLEALAQLSVVRCLQGRAVEAVAITDGVLPPVLQYGSEVAAARMRTATAIAQLGAGHLDRAAEQLALAEEVLAAVGARTPLAASHWARAEVAFYGGDPAGAVLLAEASLRHTTGTDDLFALVCRRSHHARSLHAVGARRESAHRLAAVLRDCLEAGLWMPAVDALVTAARHEADAGRPDRAAVLLAGVRPLRDRTGRHPAPVELPLHRTLDEQLRTVLPAPAHADATRRGTAMTAEALIGYALSTL
ncbi:hypothetical protein [Streptomyces sp. NRRL S-495]|uniref:hypothetical protein n=1 Tax=Streptomyces sp. NRRL S-495 TaxID=1609133 RepID=UPI0005F8E2FD|nr:hypothetical protein [Streptomyces sp. NRRL S-495]KJY28182.1 hypothetical protein VR45_33035 [Streptomyces sp. NRRL S-495]